MLIKFCGIKKKKDFLNCINLKIDAVGFVFYKKSIRYINPNKVLSILSSFKKKIFYPLKFGVFYKPKFNYFLKIYNKLDLDFYQICGNSIDKKIKNKRFEKKIIRSFGINKKNSFKLIEKINNSDRDIFFIDNFSKEGGGTGKKFPWKYIKLIKKKIFVSGGIKKENIKKIISYKPYGIDISSGIEKKPGIKSIELMKCIVKIFREKIHFS